MELEVARLTGRGADSRTKAALLFMRSKDKASGKDKTQWRVKKVDSGKDGVPMFWSGNGEKRKVFHPDDIQQMFNGDEAAQFARLPFEPQGKDKAGSEAIGAATLEMTDDDAKQVSSMEA